jgi:outer membrane protein OmpA-like peptidoglycan-associated protein
VRAALRAVPSSFKLTDQIRVREPPKVEPPADPKPPPVPPAPASTEQTAPAAPPADVQPAPKLAAPAPAPPADAQTAPKLAAPAPTPPAEPAPPPADASAGPAQPATPEPAPPAAPPAPPPAAAPASAEAPPPAAADAAPKTLAACREDLVKLTTDSPIPFDRGSAKIDAEALETLTRIAAAVKACPGVRIVVEGHADLEGIPEYNQRLSLRRAEAVAEVLAGAGLGQLETVGFGVTRPVAPNTTPQARAKNRRSVIVVRP